MFTAWYKKKWINETNNFPKVSSHTHKNEKCSSLASSTLSSWTKSLLGTLFILQQVHQEICTSQCPAACSLGKENENATFQWTQCQDAFTYLKDALSNPTGAENSVFMMLKPLYQLLSGKPCPLILVPQNSECMTSRKCTFDKVFPWRVHSRPSFASTGLWLRA